MGTEKQTVNRTDLEDILVQFSLLDLALYGLSVLAEDSVVEYEKHVRPIAEAVWSLKGELEALDERLRAVPAQGA